MSIIAFWSNEKKETAQTLSLVALTTYMAIEHNYRILNISTSFNDKTLEEAFWNAEREKMLAQTIAGRSNFEFETGVEGLIKIINSNKTSSSIVANYAKVVFKDRLDVLCSPLSKNYEEYVKTASEYPNIIEMANRDYDLVFVDISKKMPAELQKQILEKADVIVYNLGQKLTSLQNLEELRNKNTFFKKRNIIFNIGKYDKFSKYNTKNITRVLKQNKEIACVPYNTLYFDSTTEGKAAEFFLKIRGLDKKKSTFMASVDRNESFAKEVARFSQLIIYKLEELKMNL